MKELLNRIKLRSEFDNGLLVGGIVGWLLALVGVTIALLWPSAAQADGEWGETYTINGEWTLAIRGAKVLNITANASPYERQMLLCIDKAKDPQGLAPEQCGAHEGQASHFLFPVGFSEMVKLATEAKKEGDKVNLHVNTAPASVGMVETDGGKPRCYVSRLGWSD